jgi:membrane protease YdiL (CAAX protease family)
MAGIEMDPQTSTFESSPTADTFRQSANDRFRPIAPYWHTAVLVVVLVGIGLLAAWGMQHAPAPTGGPLPQYLQTIIMQWVLFGFVVFGLRRKGTSVAEVMGKPWRNFDDALIDVALASGVFVASLAVRAAIVMAVMKVTGTTPSMHDALKSVERLVPRTPAEIAVAILLALTAGFVEEFIFRGYLQRQFAAMTKNIWLGIVLSLAVFFVGHLYQGLTLQLGFVVLLGLALGVLAHWRRNLRPGILLHAGQDVISMLFLSFFARALTR